MTFKLTNPKVWGLGAEKTAGRIERKGRMPMHVCEGMYILKVRDWECLRINNKLYYIGYLHA